MTPEERQQFQQLVKDVSSLQRSTPTQQEFDDLQNQFNAQNFSSINIFTTPIRIVSSIPPQSGGQVALYIGDTTIGIYYGTGVPTIAAGKGSLYLRNDGSSTSTRAYINTDGGTTWVSITTSA